MKEIESIENKDINELKILLANETTTMLHGEKEAQSSEKAAKEAFSENSSGSISSPSMMAHSSPCSGKLIRNRKSSELKILFIYLLMS